MKGAAAVKGFLCFFSSGEWDPSLARWKCGNPAFCAGFMEGLAAREVGEEAAAGASAEGGSGAATIARGIAPKAQSPELQRVINTLYQESDRLPGGTAGAVRHELSTGDLMSPAGHSIKAANTINRLNRIIVSGRLSPRDMEVAHALVQDLRNALGGR